CLSPAAAAPKKTFDVAWTIYVGWMPWPYAADTGIVKKWADKYGITINVVQINDYVESVNQYTAGKFDGVTVTNMDALTIPAAGGVDTSAIVMGDFSNGNDGIVLKKGSKLTDIKGRKINIVELSVSHYLLARALTTVKLRERDIKIVNTSDADILPAFDSQLKTTGMFYTPKEALGFMTGPDMAKVMDSVRTFCFEHNLLGEKVKSKDAIGISMPSATLGSRQNVKLRFDPAFMKLAADA